MKPAREMWALVCDSGLVVAARNDRSAIETMKRCGYPDTTVCRYVLPKPKREVLAWVIRRTGTERREYLQAHGMGTWGPLVTADRWNAKNKGVADQVASRWDDTIVVPIVRKLS